MLRSMVRKAIRAVGRCTGVHAPRPRNLILVPSPLEPGRVNCVTAIGRDIAEIAAGCGGTLAIHGRRGSDVRVFSRSPISDGDREALSVLGISRDRVFAGSGEATAAAVHSASLVLLPFPPEAGELAILGKISSAAGQHVAFFDTRMNVLTDREFPIDEVVEEKEKSLARIGSTAYRKGAEALSIYRSVSTGRGRGFTEGFLSGRAGLCALGFRTESRWAPSYLQNLFYQRYLSALFSFRDACAAHPVSGVSGERTLVLSPHYDDEVIGAGGTMVNLREIGHEILVVFVTDGREGIPSMKNQSEVVRIRREESERALAVLGVDDSVHLGIPETRVRPDRNLISRLRGIMNEFRPGSIILPWFFDNHVDHVEVNRVFARAARGLDPDTLIMGSEVWTPLTPNFTVDCSPYAERKRRALECFESQLGQVDYLRTSMALGVRRAADAGKTGLVEAFSCLPAGSYVDRMRRAGIASMRFLGSEEDS